MNMAKINRDRLAETFMELVRIDSPSMSEGKVAEWLKDWFGKVPGAEIAEDGSPGETGSDTGNLVIRLPGTRQCKPVFFNAHMDTVEPGRGIKPRLVKGVFRSDGTTVLGGDDKAAIAILVEAVRCMDEHGLPHGPVEFLFTTCEEIGLLGAKALDRSLLRSRAGYALDSTDIDMVINEAPAAIRFHVDIRGVAAHAGINPEDGINAIRLAADAITRIPQGRIDDETTCNTGIIRGGTATNIIPDLVEVEGEVRSHNAARLRKVQDEIIGAFHRAVEDYRAGSGISPMQGVPLVASTVQDDYPLMNVPEGHPVVRAVMEAGRETGRKLVLTKTGGGSDANILNQKGLATVILGVGMQKVHTTEEFIRLADMVESCRLVIATIDAWARISVQ